MKNAKEFLWICLTWLCFEIAIFEFFEFENIFKYLSLAEGHFFGLVCLLLYCFFGLAFQYYFLYRWTSRDQIAFFRTAFSLFHLILCVSFLAYSIFYSYMLFSALLHFICLIFIMKFKFKYEA